MRISLRVEYALRAMAQLATEPPGEAIKADQLATAQDIPLKFLLGILNDLRRARLVRSQRGTEGGYHLAKAASEIALADVMRAIDGPLVNVHDASLSQLTYPGVSAELAEVWMAVRATVRSVLERVTLANLAEGRLPSEVRKLADDYRDATADYHTSTG